MSDIYQKWNPEVIKRKREEVVMSIWIQSMKLQEEPTDEKKVISC